MYISFISTLIDEEFSYVEDLETIKNVCLLFTIVHAVVNEFHPLDIYLFPPEFGSANRPFGQTGVFYRGCLSQR